MTYRIRKTNNTFLGAVEDQSINANEASLALIGLGAVQYGQLLNENFVHLLENFANTTAPSRPLAGQLWFNTNTQTLAVYNGAAWAPVGGSGSGSVTRINTGTGLIGGPIVTSGTISLSATGVLAGVYANPTITVDAQGRVTAAASGTSTLGASGVAAGTYIHPTIAVGSDGRITAAASNPVRIATGTGLSGGPITGIGTVALADTPVTAGRYVSADITVDAQGRITAAADEADSGVAAGTYAMATITVNGKGRVTGAVSDTATVPADPGTLARRGQDGALHGTIVHSDWQDGAVGGTYTFAPPADASAIQSARLDLVEDRFRFLAITAAGGGTAERSWTIDTAQPGGALYHGGNLSFSRNAVAAADGAVTVGIPALLSTQYWNDGTADIATTRTAFGDGNAEDYTQAWYDADHGTTAAVTTTGDTAILVNVTANLFNTPDAVFPLGSPGAAEVAVWRVLDHGRNGASDWTCLAPFEICQGTYQTYSGGTYVNRGSAQQYAKTLHDVPPRDTPVQYRIAARRVHDNATPCFIRNRRMTVTMVTP